MLSKDKTQGAQMVVTQAGFSKPLSQQNYSIDVNGTTPMVKISVIFSNSFTTEL